MNQPLSTPTPLIPAASPQLAHVVVYGNPKKPGLAQVLQSLSVWSAQGGHQIHVELSIAEVMDQIIHRGEPNFVIFNGDDPGTSLTRSDRPTLLLTLGGDGTLLHAVHRFWPIAVPVLGVSLGTLSFNAAVTPNRVVDALDLWLAGGMMISPRLVLKVSCVRDGRSIHETVAVNDVVLGKHENLRMIRLSLRQGDELVSDFAGDGLIVSTPTGSTAYNLSAGGPIVYPTMRVAVATAICPHTLAARAVVLHPEPPLIMEYLPPEHAQTMVSLAIDGQTQWPIQAGDRVVIEACESPLKMAVHPEQRYFARLRQKLSWSGEVCGADTLY